MKSNRSRPNTVSPEPGSAGGETNQVCHETELRERSRGDHLKPEPLLLRPTEVAEMLGISRTKAYELIEGGVLPVIRIGRSVRVPRQGLLAWIDKNTEQAA